VTASVKLDVSAGAVVTLDGAEWAVDLVEPHYGMVALARGGERMRVSMRFLLHYPGRERSSRVSALAADRRQDDEAITTAGKPEHHDS
jgi:hypothetical protein